jgi:hypothetical protein
LAERRARLTEQGQMLRARVQEIEQQRRDRAAELRLLEGVEAFCTSIRDAMVAPSFAVKQKILQLIVQRIVVEDHRIIIEHVVPSGPLRLQTEHHSNRKLRFQGFCRSIRLLEWVFWSLYSTVRADMPYWLVFSWPYTLLSDKVLRITVYSCAYAPAGPWW